MPGSIFGIALRPTSGQGVIWSETLGGRMDVGADSQPASQLTGLTLNRVPFGNSLGGLQDSGNLTFDGSTLTLTGALGVSGIASFTNGTASTSSATGAVVITGTGGLGVGGRLSVAGGSNGSTHITTVGNYGFLAFGGTADFTTGTGVAGGSASDPDFYFVCPDTRGFHMRINGSDALLLNQLGANFAPPVIFPAATTGIPSCRLPHGTAPSSPTNGDMWTTTAGLYVRINGVTVGPLS